VMRADAAAVSVRVAGTLFSARSVSSHCSCRTARLACQRPARFSRRHDNRPVARLSIHYVLPRHNITFLLWGNKQCHSDVE
jgi:hypothetical protein